MSNNRGYLLPKLSGKAQEKFVTKVDKSKVTDTFLELILESLGLPIPNFNRMINIGPRNKNALEVKRLKEAVILPTLKLKLLHSKTKDSYFMRLEFDTDPLACRLSLIALNYVKDNDTVFKPFKCKVNKNLYFVEGLSESAASHHFETIVKKIKASYAAYVKGV